MDGIEKSCSVLLTFERGGAIKSSGLRRVVLYVCITILLDMFLGDESVDVKICLGESTKKKKQSK